MKKIGIWLFVVFILIGGLYAVVQGEIGRRWTRDLLTQALAKAGFTATIGQVEGALPHQIILKAVSVQGQGIALSIDELKLRPVLWRLLEREVAFNQVQARGIVLNGATPFDFNGNLRLKQEKSDLAGRIDEWDLTAQFEPKNKLLRFTARSPLLNAKGRALFGETYQLANASIQINTDHLPAPATGRVLAHLFIAPQEGGYAAKVTWQIPHLAVGSEEIGAVQGQGDATWVGRTLQGALRAEPSIKADFDLTFDPEWRLSGTTQIAIDSLQALHVPNVYGSLVGKGIWEIADQKQILHLDLTATDFYYGSLFAQQASLYSDLIDPFHQISGLLDLELQKAKWEGMELETVSVETVRGEENWPFKLLAEGKWKHPLTLQMEGNWSDAIAVQVDRLEGTFFDRPFGLRHPVHAEWKSDQFDLPEVEIAMAGGSVFASLNRKGDRADGHLRLVQIPLEVLAINPLAVPIEGFIDLEADIQERDHRLQGDLKASLSHLQPFDASGSLTGHFNRDLLTLKGQLGMRNEPLLLIDLSLPIHASLWPFKASLLTHKSAHGHLVLNGRVEEWLDFIDLGSHHLEGICQADIRFTNTLARPLVEGTIQFQDGFYQNYYTGTELHQIQADFLAEKNSLFLRSLTAHDAPGSGTLAAQGKIQLLEADLYPFRLDVGFSHLRFAEIDLVTATADGRVSIEGNRSAARAIGSVEITQADLTIPDHIPHPLPNLQVIYRNPIHPIALTEEHTFSPNPLHLELQVTAPHTVTV